MGGSNSTAALEVDNRKRTQKSVRNPIRYTFCRRRRIIISNNSKVHASFAITAGPIKDIASLSVDKVGSIAFDKTGTDRVQKFKILSYRPRRVSIHSNYLFITVYLFIENEWKQLWVNREFYQLDNISIWDHHIEEASIEQGATTTSSLPNRVSLPSWHHHSHPRRRMLPPTPV